MAGALKFVYAANAPDWGLNVPFDVAFCCLCFLCLGVAVFFVATPERDDDDDDDDEPLTRS